MGAIEMTTRSLILLFVIIVGMIQIPAQEKKSVVYLKSGRIISGTIIELIPNDFVRIEIDAVTIRTIPFSEIASIRSERMEYETEANGSFDYLRRISVTLFAGGAFSADEFASISNAKAGYASTGYLAGGAVNFPVFRSFVLNAVAAVSNNAVDEDGLHNSGVPRSIEMTTSPWSIFWTLPGIGWKTNLDEVTITAALNYGWAHTKTPSINLTGNFSNCTAHPFQTTSAAYGFSLEAVVWHHASIAFRSFTANPTIPITVMSNPEYLKTLSGNPSIPRDINDKQPISIYCLTAGISF
jgi:hypothetical protein